MLTFYETINIPLIQYSNIPAFPEEFFLFDGHLLASLPCSFMVISKKVKNTVDHQEGNHSRMVKTKSIRLAICCLYRNDQITQKVRLENRKLALPHREGDDIGGFFPVKVSPIQFLNLDIINQ